MHDVNLWWAVPVAAVSSFALGGLWYSPLAFGKAGARELQKTGQAYPAASLRIFLGSFFLTLVESLAFAWLVGIFAAAPLNGFAAHVGSLHPGLAFGCLVGGGFVAAASGINYLFSGRSMKLLLIDGGFHLARYVLYGLVLGTFH